MVNTIGRALVIGVLAGCVSPVVRFGEGKTAKEAQRDTMSAFGPASLVTGEKWAGKVATEKIRVWADEPYRTQNRQWQQSFEEPLELANLVLTPITGLRLVAEYEVWHRNVPGAKLAEDLAALQERDPGDGAFAVVGLTSSLPLVSATFDELGLATIGGRHMVMRGYADLEERKQYANAFPDLRAEERELALVHLRHHKSAVVLLHELGHILGLGHESDPKMIMNATYSNHATSFSAQTRATMLAAVDQRLHRKSAIARVASAPPPPSPQGQPQAQVAAPAAVTPHAPVVIRVSRKGATIVEGKPLREPALDALLTATFAENPATKIVISEDRNVPAGIVGGLIDRAKAIGFTKFEFAWSGK